MTELQAERLAELLENQQAMKAAAIEQLAKDLFAEMGGDFEDCIELAREELQ